MLDLNSFNIVDVIVMNGIQYHDSPFFCPVCDHVMSTTIDIESYKDCKCCRDCENDFVDKNREKWLNGWRPNKDEVKKALQFRKFS